MKVDLRKAYDSLSWDFVRDLLRGLGFYENFINWVMICVSYRSYSLSIKCSLCGFFANKSELRQGDPSSPLLFVLAMEYCSRLMSKMSKKQVCFSL